MSVIPRLASKSARVLNLDLSPGNDSEITSQGSINLSGHKQIHKGKN